MAVIRGESCFEKNAFEDTENLHPPTKTRLPVKEYLGKYLIFHGKLSFDNLTYFKLYGNLKRTEPAAKDIRRLHWRLCSTRLELFGNEFVYDNCLFTKRSCEAAINVIFSINLSAWPSR